MTIEVTQEDRDAAKLAYGTTPFELEELFARHRQAAHGKDKADYEASMVRVQQNGAS